MSSARSRSPERSAEIAATLLLAVTGVGTGSFLGAFYLIYAPDDPIRPAWTAVCIALLALPVLAAFGAVWRLLDGRIAVWVPLLGIAAIVVLMFVIVLMGMASQPPPPNLAP